MNIHTYVYTYIITKQRVNCIYWLFIWHYIRLFSFIITVFVEAGLQLSRRYSQKADRFLWWTSNTDMTLLPTHVYGGRALDFRCTTALYLAAARGPPCTPPPHSRHPHTPPPHPTPKRISIHRLHSIFWKIHRNNSREKTITSHFCDIQHCWMGGALSTYAVL